MASSFGARRSENVDALFTQAVESFVGVDAGEENLSIAHNYCLYHAKHHSFPDTDPRKVRGALDALRKRLGIHAQLDKQRALDMLVGRFERRPWPADVPDVHARVLQLLLGLSRNPLQSKYTHIDAAAAVGEDDGVGATRDRLAGLDGDHADLLAALRGAGAGGAPAEFDDDYDDDDYDERSDPGSDSDLAAARDGRSDSTLSDWTDDEAEDARVGALRRDVAAAADAARRDARSTSAASRGPRLVPTESSPAPPTTPASRGPDSRDVGRRRRRPSRRRERPPRRRQRPSRRRERPRRPHRRRHRRRRRRRATKRRRPAAAASAASRLYPALVAARAKVSAANLPGSRRLGTEARAVGDALHALQGHADPRAVPSSVPHLSPSALEGATRRARSVASALDAAAAVADVVLDPARSAVANGFETTGPTTRACATAVLGMTRERRDALAPMLQRAAGTGVRGRADAVGSTRARLGGGGAREGAGVSRAPRFPPKDGATPSAAASRCLTALARAAAAWQTSPGVGAGFVVATRLLCASAQPYLAATHAWIEEGALDDVAGEFFVREGEARGAKIGTEANWERGFELRRGRLGEPECPEFFAACAEEIFAAGKAARLMRAEDRPGWIAREDSETGSREEGDAGTFPTARRHLCVEFCRRARAALETGAAFADEDDDEDEDEDEEATRTGHETEDAVEDDDSVEMLRGTSLEAFPSRPGPGVARSTRDSAFASTEETATLLACGLAGSTTRVVAFVGERVGGAGHRFDARRLLRRRRVSTRGYRRQRRRWRRRRVPSGRRWRRRRWRRRGRAPPPWARRSWHVCAVGGGFVVASSRFARYTSAARARRRRRSRRLCFVDSTPATTTRSTPPSSTSRSPRRSPRTSPEPFPTRGTCPWRWRRGRHPDRVRSPSRGRAPRDWQSWRGYACAFESRGRSRSSSPRAASSVTRTPARFSCSFARRGRRWRRRRRAGGPRRRDAPRAAGGGFHARRLAAECRHFVAALHEHVATRVLHASWADLVAAVDRAETPKEAKEAHAAFLDGACRQCLASPDPTWTLLAGQTRAALAAACDLAAARRRTAKEAAAAAQDADPTVGRCVVGTWGAANAAAAAQAAALAGYGPVPEAEAERLASAFRRARSYVLRVVESKLKIGSFPELAELRLRLDFNGFYGTKDRGGGEE